MLRQPHTSSHIICNNLKTNGLYILEIIYNLTKKINSRFYYLPNLNIRIGKTEQKNHI